MLVTDELKHRKRAVGLMFFDFVEALARLADFISPPSMEKMLEANAIAAATSEMQGSESLASDAEYAAVIQSFGVDLGKPRTTSPAQSGTLMKEPSLTHQLLGGGSSAYRLAKEASLHLPGGLLAKEGSIHVMDRSKSRDIAELQPPHPLVEYLQRTGGSQTNAKPRGAMNIMTASMHPWCHGRT